MKQFRRFLIMLSFSVLAAAGVVLAGVWMINGLKAALFSGVAVFAAAIVLLIVFGKKTKEGDMRTHGFARVFLTVLTVALALLTIALPAKYMLGIAKMPISAKGLFGADKTTLIAHRGFSSEMPQNTVPAFELAAEIGMDGYEFDVHTTKDGVWVVNHDESIDHMTDGSGNISDYTYEELMAFNVDNGNNIEMFNELKLPTLDEALDVCVGRDIFPVIEIKECDPQYFDSLLDAVYSRRLEEKAVIISFSMEYLEGIRELDPDIKMSYLSNRLSVEDVDKCVALKNTGVDVNAGNIFKMAKALRYARSQGLEMIAWTVDHPVFAEIAACFGIDTLTTNRIYPVNVDWNGRGVVPDTD